MFAIKEEGSVDQRLTKTFVQDRLSYVLRDDIWEAIDLAFSKKWNEHLGYGSWFYWDEISDFVYSDIALKQILMSYTQVDEIVNLMLTYIERTGGFLDDDRF